MDYINTFLKLKAEASVYFGWVHSPEDEERYADSFVKGEGIRLDKEAIRYNAAKRGLAKLCLNSMWGELTERNDRSKTKIINEAKNLYGFFTTPGIEVMNLMFASDDVVWIAWKYRGEEQVPSMSHTNEVIGVYVTAVVRMYLYPYLNRLGTKAM